MVLGAIYTLDCGDIDNPADDPHCEEHCNDDDEDDCVRDVSFVIHLVHVPLAVEKFEVDCGGLDDPGMLLQIRPT